MHPEFLQGSFKKKDYFEGWYYKLVSPDKNYVLSIIPGFSTAKNDAHAFIQVIDSKKSSTAYVRYPVQEFSASDTAVNIGIGNSRFLAEGITLDISGGDFTLSGHLKFYDIVPFPKKLLFRGVMGPFGFMPFMECYHGIVNIRHRLKGSLTVNGETVDFNGGTGYIEKDWGRSFPSAWVWVQANYYEKNATVMLSIAKIPFMGRHFTGIISFLYLDGKYYPVATYNGAKIKDFTLDEQYLSIILKNKKYALSLKASRTKGGILKAPAKGLMHRDIEETLSAVSQVEFSLKNGTTIFAEKNDNTCMEICGDIVGVVNTASK